MNFSAAEEMDLERTEIHQDRIRKLVVDRKPKNGNKKFAATDGLKPIRKAQKSKPIFETDDGETVDLRFVRSLKDVEEL